MALISRIKRLVVEILSILHDFFWARFAKLGPQRLPPPQESSPRDVTARHKKMEEIRLPSLNRPGHAAHAKRCLSALPDSKTDLDASRLALAFYNIGILDLLDILNDGTTLPQWQRDGWIEWLWAQQTHGEDGSGFRPSPFMVHNPPGSETKYSNYDTPHIIMTYTALLALALLRDDFSRLDRPGLIKFLRACQREDGSFTTTPKDGESDLRTLYCAFAISAMLDDWSGIDVGHAKAFIASCRTYEGGYGQEPFCEALGGTTYTALASLYLAPPSPGSDPLTTAEKNQTVRWLVNNQASSGGFAGRTGKSADSCYCFWCGAALKILDMSHLIETKALASFLSECQFKFGGIAKCQDEHPDPYHTYLSIAALCMYPPSPLWEEEKPESWKFPVLDPLLNARVETAEWARRYISGK
ncbi:terpenoid cyclases/Protein prenyltransferase [Macrolepiota fuliginosa MF-IS2]|uniref:Terpenoid cyclases/Protein prenyltransferase n=1 Tax=Macrolepiota fuliginosa MF-IS2 TaxID=1400762 RepID=A0A9P5XLS0_9AGAR|nr:terpenoid cyclases/Protein prenyltransferase [Macrolepiota fuliginosa MF-IS2]